MLPDVPLVLPQSLAAHWESVGLRVAHLLDLLFWPERVAAAVFVAFSWEAPLALMWACALSRPVDFVLDVPLALPLLSLVEPMEPLLEEPLAPIEPEVEPLLPDDEPVPLIEEPFPDVDDVPLPYVLPVLLEPAEGFEPALL